jgi:selenocysteine-specific elongation factor
MTVVVGTAGHIDHGKTALLRALTGIDADRLPEERRRGMTIDVGYAHLRLPDGREIDFVDVPGHDRLIGNMLVGASEIDAALLVVAADDGPRAQTLEHLELLDALDIRVGLAAVTKLDLVDQVRADEVVAAVRSLLARTTLAGSPVVAVSASRGDGLAGLAEEIAALPGRMGSPRVGSGDRAGSEGAAAEQPARLAIDRVFSIRGRGTVVTGSLRGGRLEAGRSLRIEPGGRSVRAREIQVHGSTVDAVHGGGRVAVNLAGEVEPRPGRGDVLTTDPEVAATADVLVVLRAPAVLGGADRRTTPWPPPPGSVQRIHIGTAVGSARIGRGRRDLADLPDGRRIVRLRLEPPLAIAPRDAFVLRRPSPALTVAGGRILDRAAPTGPSRLRSTPERLAALATAEDPAAGAAARLELHGAIAVAEPPGHRLAPDVGERLVAEALTLVERAGPAGLSLAAARPAIVARLRRSVTLDRGSATRVVAALLDGLVAGGDLVRDGDRVRPRGSAPVPGLSDATVAAMDRLERALSVVAPPPLGEAAAAAGCPPDGVRALETSGRIVLLDGGLAYAASTFDELRATALGMAARVPLSPAAFRDATGTSRRYVMALLEELDRRGILARTPAGHVPGPRAGR